MAVFLFIYYPSYKHQIYDLNVSIRKELAARNDAVLLFLVWLQLKSLGYIVFTLSLLSLAK